MQYDICSVNWNQKQTDLWLHYVKKNCPDVHVTLIPDEKPIPWCWSGGKINCFKQDFKTDKVIYLDTDVIVTQDLAVVFDMMGEATIAASSAIPRVPFNKRPEMKQKLAPLGPMPPHFSSGMIISTMAKPALFADSWEDMCNDLKPLIGKDHYMEEIALSYLIQHAALWDIPLEVHGNICGKKYFGSVNTPAVIHYHRPKRLENYGLGHYLRIK